MNEIGAIQAVSGTTEASSPTQITITQVTTGETTQLPNTASGEGFGVMLSEAIANLDGKVAEADQMVAHFAIDESTPIHHVTIALEEARMAVELATQVRQRLTEGYRQIMNMQI